MFWTRLISGVILVALSVFFIGMGGDILLFSTLVISLVGLFELYRVFKIENKIPGILGYIACVAYYMVLRLSHVKESFPQFLMNKEIIFVLFLLILLAVFVLGYPRYHSNQIMAAFFGIFYVAVMLSFIYQTRMLSNGKYVVWLIFLCSWGCDTCAYCVGKLIGRHKMSPVLSPKKSVEGAIGGVLGSMILTALYGVLFLNQIGLCGSKEILILSIISGIGALFSMVGDLAASAIKRNFDIKDYGKLIPGHGGILDRFDSMIITAPVIYYLAYYFGF
ncbi:MAG: phosphatidate cytidylyltransferase [Lachnospiraceae bacterium]|nr:phosphatidate cytidylyltransferase [Lachnospiraceae bacterium]